MGESLGEGSMTEEEARRFVAGLALQAGLDRCEREEARAHAAWQEARRELVEAMRLQREHEGEELGL